MDNDRLLQAIKLMGDAFHSNEALGHMTCGEIDTVVDVFLLAGMPDEAREALASHAIGDYEKDDTHYEVGQSQDPDEAAMPFVRASAAALGIKLA